MTVSQLKKRPDPLPTDVDSWMSRLKQKAANINDEVMHVHFALVQSDPSYVPLLEALEDSEAVNGSMAFDDFAASLKIHARARADDNIYLKDLSPARLLKALKACLNKLKFGRHQRLNSSESEDGST